MNYPNVYCAGCGHAWWLHHLGALFRLFIACPKCGEEGPLLLDSRNENEERQT